MTPAEKRLADAEARLRKLTAPLDKKAADDEKTKAAEAAHQAAVDAANAEKRAALDEIAAEQAAAEAERIAKLRRRADDSLRTAVPAALDAAATDEPEDIRKAASRFLAGMLGVDADPVLWEAANSNEAFLTMDAHTFHFTRFFDSAELWLRHSSISAQIREPRDAAEVWGPYPPAVAA